MRQVQVRGCLPALVVLVLIGALLALVISASLAVALPVAAALLVLGLARALWYRLTGRRPPPPFGTTFRTVRIEQGWAGVEPQGAADDEGPVVDALPRRAPQGAPGGARDEDPGGEPGRPPGPRGPDRPAG
jgi:hypothetical protein